ncbi:hypothetical protein ACFE04_006206 [Oxalis oulophora]
MDLNKKRKLEENGVESDTTTKLSLEDCRKLVDRLSHDQVLDILQKAVSKHVDVLADVRSLVDADSTQRKLFIRGLGWETTTENLRSIFSVYGDIEEAVVILDKQTGKSKGYGFVTFKHVDGALLALKEPSKKIDSRVAVAQLAAAGSTASNGVGGGGGGQGGNLSDVSMRKIYVANVPYEMPSDRLLAVFSQYGEIEEGPLGFDKLTGKSKGFALFVYKSVEGAHAALVEPAKMIDGRTLNCKLAIDGKKKPGAGPNEAGHAQVNVLGDGMGMGMQGHNAYGIPGGGHGGIGSYATSYTGGPGPMGHGVGAGAGPGHVAGSLGGSGGYYTGYGGPGSTGFGGPGSTGYGGPGSGPAAGPGLGGAGAGSSMYRLPPGTGGMPSGGYPEARHYSMSTSSAYPSQGTSSFPRIPPGGMYQNAPPYY